MVFESYEGPPSVEPGDLFIGYFLRPRPDQTLEVQPGFVELIAWDRTKRVFNFWELTTAAGTIGATPMTSWPTSPGSMLARTRRFRTRPASMLRLSHAGAPIMKELEAPHNDWWTTAGRLNLGPFVLSSGTNPLDPAHVAGSLFRRPPTRPI